MSAVKFTKKGGIIVASRIEPTSSDELKITVTVTDTGIGFSNEGDKLFNYFVQVRFTISRDFCANVISTVRCTTKKLWWFWARPCNFQEVRGDDGW